MKRATAAIACSFVWVISTPAGASAGGGENWFWDGQRYDRVAYAPGETVHGTVEVWIKSRYSGRPEHGPWYAYLVRDEGDDMPFPPPLPKAAQLLGEVTLDPYERTDSYAVARVTFTMPDVPAGDRYAVVHCNDPCTKPLGDLFSTQIEVVESAVEGRLLRRINQLEDRSFNFRERENARFLRMQGRFTHIERNAARLEEELRNELERLDALVAQAEDEPNPLQGPALSLVALTGLVGLGALLVRRRA